MCETFFEAHINRFLKLGDDVVELLRRCFQIGEFFRKKFVALFRLIEFLDHCIAITQA